MNINISKCCDNWLLWIKDDQENKVFLTKDFKSATFINDVGWYDTLQAAQTARNEYTESQHAHRCQEDLDVVDGVSIGNMGRGYYIYDMLKSSYINQLLEFKNTMHECLIDKYKAAKALREQYLQRRQILVKPPNTTPKKSARVYAMSKRKLLTGEVVHEEAESVPMTIDSKCPAKWLFVDCENGNIWYWCTTDKTFLMRHKDDLHARRLLATYKNFKELSK